MAHFLGKVKYGWHGRCEEIPGTNGKKQVVLEKPEGSPNRNYVQGEYHQKWFHVKTMLPMLPVFAVGGVIISLMMTWIWKCTEKRSIGMKYTGQYWIHTPFLF